MSSQDPTDYQKIQIEVERLKGELAKIRQRAQLAIAIFLVSFGVGIVAVYMYLVQMNPEDPLVSMFVNGAWTLVVAGIGMSFAYFGLGRTVS